MGHYIDLSHSLHTGMPVYPGTKPPVFQITSTLQEDGFIERSIELYSHVGTHMDVPAHLFANGKSIEEYPVGHFTGKALLIRANNNSFSIENIRSIKKNHSSIDFILFITGWDKHWGRPLYFESFPVPDEKILSEIVNTGIKGIGIDTISIDKLSDSNLPNHRLLLSNDIFIIENLRNLSSLKSNVIEFFCFPLKISKGDASPVRAVANIN